jgi:hypothetical protein
MDRSTRGGAASRSDASTPEIGNVSAVANCGGVKRRYATHGRIGAWIRGLKSTATFVSPLRGVLRAFGRSTPLRANIPPDPGVPELSKLLRPGTGALRRPGLLAAAALAFVGLFLADCANGADEPIPQLRPPRGEIPPTFWEQYGVWVWAGGALLAVLAGIVTWYLRRPKPAVIVPPDVAARLALEPLRTKAEDGALLSRVSQVLRRYFAAAFAMEPGELTTTEFCAAIAGNAQIGRELAAGLSDFLRRCDERKFAPNASGPPLEAAAKALRFIDLAEARLATLRSTPPTSVTTPAKAAATP